MIDGPFLGVILHSGGGVAHGTFYAPLHKIKKWSWESGWIVQGFVAWVIVPWVVAVCCRTNPVEAFSNSSRESIVWTYLFGVMWGFGSLTFGLTMRYLGMSLGMAVALGFCMTFGTLIPPVYEQFFGDPESGNVTITVLLTTISGAVTLAGIAVCLLGIGQCGYAGMRKERELTDEQKKEGIKEFALGKGFLVAVFSGIMSAGFAYAIKAGEPVAEAALQSGAPDILKNAPVFILAMAGGFTVNCIWCVILNIKNKSYTDYLGLPGKMLGLNFLFAATAGTIWYTGFFFYGMGTTFMGEYDFSSWSIHLAFVIMFSTICGITLKEWKGVSKKTMSLVYLGLVLLLLSTVITAIGSSSAASNEDTAEADVLRIDDLRCEYLKDPLGVDEITPRLNWRLESGERGQRQTAYRLLVASSRENLGKDIGDLWDTGKVKSDQSIHVAYAGKPLESRIRCHWKVRVWDKDPKASNWSEPAEWSMGLLQPEDWKAKWITNPAPERLSHPWLRRRFDLKENVERAVIHVNTASYYELHINGKKISPYVLTPGISKIDKRFLINTYDVTSYLVKGTNCIALWMGPGWHQPRNGNKYNAPILRAQLDIHSPSGLTVIGTDSRWRVKKSCITQIGGWKWNNFGGEHYDGREFVPGWDQADLDDSKWLTAREIPAPNVVHSWQGCESARLSQPVSPKKIFQLKNGKWVIDFGRPLTGWMRLQMHDLKEAQEVKIIYADVNDNANVRKLAHKVNSDGFQSFNQEDVFISAGKGKETFCSKFNYHSFRYAVISGLTRGPDMKDAVAMMIEPEFKSAGSFECSNNLFNQIHEITRYTLRTQNPGLALGTGEAREKSAYGDGGAHLSGYLYNFKCDANFRKWIRDWSDGQREDGWFGHTAPAFEDHGGGPAWGGQVTELVRRMHLYYGDNDMVEQMYDRLCKYVDFLESKTRDGILRSYTPTRRSESWMFIGDWVRPQKAPGKGFYMDTKEEREFFNNCYRAMLWQQLQDYAESLGRADEYKRCSDHLATIRPLIHKTFYLTDKGTYTFNNQSCLAMALYARIPPRELRPKILALLEHEIVVNKKGHLDTGLLATFIMLDLLIKEDRNDLIALIMGQTTYPGWGYLIKEMGLNTWPETWSGWGSHVILVTATPDSWFFEGLGGILPDPKTPGFKHFTLRPGVVKSVDWVKCSYQSPYGKIVSDWKITDGTFKWKVTVPPNTTATVYIPVRRIEDVTDNGKNILKTSSVKFLRMDKNKAVFRVDSGSYEFVSKHLEE